MTMELLRKTERTSAENANVEQFIRLCDLSNEDLTDCDFSGLRILRARFSGSQMSGCRFVRSALTMADFTGAKLDGADFSSAYLENANFDGANLVGAKFTVAVIRGGVFANADLSFARFEKTVFFNCYTKGVDFKDARMTGAYMNRIKDPRRAIENLVITRPSYLRSIRDRAHLNRIAKHWYMPPDIEWEISLYII
jgi:uncharacterized protein YjbI with pentapeptide repeats